MEDRLIREASLAERLSNAMVGIFKEYVGRGPTRARVSFTGDVVIGMFSDTLNKAERTLVEHGQGDMVTDMRRRIQSTMRDDLVAAVEEHTGRKVLAFLSDNHLDPDIAVEVFVLESGQDGFGSDGAP